MEFYRRYFQLSVLFLFFSGLSHPVLAKPKVYTSYLWHMQQPNYWPEQARGKVSYMTAAEQLREGSSIYPGHPQNNLGEIFGKDDRVAAYQWRTKDSVAAMGRTNAGAQLSYSGVLIENIASLGKNFMLGYSPSWKEAVVEAMSWKTASGYPKLEPLGFSYHHALVPLIPKEALEMELALDRISWKKTWAKTDETDITRGFRCSEEAFSQNIIKELVEAGYKWVIVPNHHLARTHSNYQPRHHKGVYDLPNRADQINGASENWFSGEVDGRGATLSVPFSYQAHWAKYVDPESGQEYKIIVVPMSDILSYRDGYSPQGTDLIDQYIAPYIPQNHPAMILFSHDGDNAWGGGYSYYQEAVPRFVQAAANKGYEPTTIATFLSENPPPADDIVHVEDGAWVNAADDWGHPQFLNWLWYPQRDRRSLTYDYRNPATYADIENGWAEDFRNWAVIIAGQNYVSMAEQVFSETGGQINLNRIQDPDKEAGLTNDAELAWHFFLPSLTSGYMYYGASLDMEVKPTLAVNQAIDHAQKVLNGMGKTQDNTPPSVFIPQRYPYNPGSQNHGPAYGYKPWVAPTSFYIWTLAYDVSNIERVTLKVREDFNGFNPLSDNDNETYKGGPSVGSWNSYVMHKREGEAFKENIFGSHEINFFIQPKAIADQYWFKVTQYRDQLLDYYVEAVDSYGNIHRSDIQHVYVGLGE